MFIPEITLMIQYLMIQTMRIIYLYRLFKKDLMQCLVNPLFVAGLELKKCLHKEKVIKCETQRELRDLEDYEAIALKIEHKPVTKPEYRSLAMQSFSLIVKKNRLVKY